MSIFRLVVVVVLFVCSTLAAGCGDSSPTPVNTAPNDKQKQKEDMKFGPGGGGKKK